MRVHYYPTILLLIAVIDHNSESAKIKRKINSSVPKVSISFTPTTNESSPSTATEVPKTILLDLPPPGSPSATYAYDGIEFRYFSPDSDGSAGDRGKSRIIKDIHLTSGGTGMGHSQSGYGDYSDSDSSEEADVELAKLEILKVAKVAKSIVSKFVIGGLGKKLVLKTLFTVGSGLASFFVVPAVSSVSFLAGALFGRLTAGIINPPVTPAPAPGTTTTTTTTTPSPGGTRMVSLFFGTDLSGMGAMLSAPVGMCIDFPQQVDNMVQSIDTMGNCLLICDTAGCTGTCYRFTGATTINNLGSFNLMASSLMLC